MNNVEMNNFMYIFQNYTIEQLKEQIEQNQFVDKNLKDFNKGKEIIDELIELHKSNLDCSVQKMLIIYGIYKAKCNHIL